MQKIKYKYFIFIIPILIFSGIWFPIINIIITTLKFDPYRNQLTKEPKYSYLILSSDDKVLSKLSRKFEINNDKHKIPLLSLIHI